MKLSAFKKSSGFRRSAAVVGVLLVAVLIYVGQAIYRANFHTVLDGKVYRAAQMNSTQLTRTIRDHQIKSIINLRGANQTDWYTNEMEISRLLEIKHYDFGISANKELTPVQLDDLVQLLHAAPKPVLIHCQHGADRTGLASALYCLAIEGQSVVEADKQLSVWYGHIPIFKTIAMDKSFWFYASNHIGAN